MAAQKQRSAGPAGSSEDATERVRVAVAAEGDVKRAQSGAQVHCRIAALSTPGPRAASSPLMHEGTGPTPLPSLLWLSFVVFSLYRLQPSYLRVGPFPLGLGLPMFFNIGSLTWRSPYQPQAPPLLFRRFFGVSVPLALLCSSAGFPPP